MCIPGSEGEPPAYQGQLHPLGFSQPCFIISPSLGQRLGLPDSALLLLDQALFCSLPGVTLLHAFSGNPAMLSSVGEVPFTEPPWQTKPTLADTHFQVCKHSCPLPRQSLTPMIPITSFPDSYLRASALQGAPDSLPQALLGFLEL